MAHPQSSLPHVCILGGGFGGLYTALALAKRGRRRVRITLVEPKAEFLFTPLLYETLTGELYPWEIAPPYATLLQGTAIDHRVTTAEKIDPDRRQVTLASGETLTYDALVVALGSRDRTPPIPGLGDHSLRFRTLADALALDRHLHPLETSSTDPIPLTIVGGGPSGVELACKVADRLGPRAQVQLVERGDRLLKPFSPRERRIALGALGKRRISIHLHTSISALGPDWVTLDGPEGSRTQPTKGVIWVAGSEPVPWPGVEPLNPTPSGQYPPLASLQVADYPEVFILGDQAAMGWRQQRPAPRTAQAAYQAGPTVAHNILALLGGRRPRPFRYFHMGDMMTLGRGNALVSSFGLVWGGPLAALTRQIVYLQRLPTWGHRGRVLRSRLAGGTAAPR